MFKVINKNTGKVFGEYEDRRTADKAMREYLIKNYWIKDTLETIHNGRVISRSRNRG